MKAPALLALLALLGSCAGAASQTAPGPHHAFPRPASPDDECTCRGTDGRAYLLGERVCLRTSEGPRLAECAMVLNNTSWRTSAVTCPDS